MALEADVVNRAAQLYGIAASELKPLRGGLANLVYGFSKGGRRYVLRLTPPNEDVGLPEMKAILTWMHFLAGHGGLVPGPAASERGEWVEVVEQAGQRYLATALEQARGVLSETLSPGQWTEALYESLGRTVGRLHALAKDYAPGAALKRPDWDAGGNVFTDARRLEPSQAAIAEKYAEVMGRIAGLPKDRDGYGMIHADLHFGNFFVDPESGVITCFDFDSRQEPAASPRACPFPALCAGGPPGGARGDRRASRSASARSLTRLTKQFLSRIAGALYGFLKKEPLHRSIARKPPEGGRRTSGGLGRHW